MKRIMNAVAVQTLLCTMRPQQEVEIFDAPEYTVPLGDLGSSSKSTVYTVDELLHNYENERIIRAQIRRTEVKNSRLFLMIDTAHEYY